MTDVIPAVVWVYLAGAISITSCQPLSPSSSGSGFGPRHRLLFSGTCVGSQHVFYKRGNFALHRSGWVSECTPAALGAADVNSSGG